MPESVLHRFDRAASGQIFAAARAIPILYFQDIRAVLDAADFVAGLLIEAAMAVIYGQSNSGKTFWTLDLALHVAAGRTWCGREVERGGVVWLAMEGSYGISNRIAAWCLHHGIDGGDLPFAVVPVALDLLDPDADTAPLIATIAEIAGKIGVAVRLVVVDTLSRAMAGGNENAPDDMGALVTNGTAIQQATRAAVAWIHHSGKDEAKGARGHSLLRAATDTEIEITAEGPDHLARVTKQRELDCDGEFRFELEVVHLGTNRRGSPVTSCVVKNASDAGQAAGAASVRRRLTQQQQRALEVLADLVAASGQGGYAGIPAGTPSVPEKWWRDRFYDRSMPGEDQDAKQKAFRRAANALIAYRLVGMSAGRVWVGSRTSQGDTAAPE